MEHNVPTLVHSRKETPPAPPAGGITDDEAAAAFRAVVRLFGHWQLDERQAADLLDVSLSTYRRWREGGKPNFDRDGRARLSNLLGIHKALRLIFREPQRGYAWVKVPNEAFGGVSALNVMLGNDLTALMRVRRYLDAERGGW